jgi:DNA mismatch repair protein MutS
MKVTAVKKAQSLTPMMRQYMEIKKRHPGTVLLYRMGDFYEMFHGDAKIASEVLGLTLTSRNHGGTDKTPLAGFPHHSLDRYANRLVHSGYKIAICEQVEDPKTAKGIVKRDVIEIITAGTATEDNFIDEKRNNFIISIVCNDKKAGLSICDLSTGEFLIEEIVNKKIEEEISRIDPQEILIPDSNKTPLFTTLRNQFHSILFSTFDSWKFHINHATDTLKDHFKIASIQGIGLESYSLGIGAAGALLSYLKEQKKNDLKHIVSIKPRSLNEFAELDPASIRNLELLRPIHSDDSKGTLIAVLDKTGTAMGARLMKQWITHPLKNLEIINSRLDCVEWLKNNVFIRGEIGLHLKSVADIERLIGRISFERANARDLIALKDSIKIFPLIIKCLETTPCDMIKIIGNSLNDFESITDDIEKTIIDSPPLTIREGGIIKPGISKEVDEIKDAAANGKQWIAQLQQTEREKTGISKLKVSYNKVFGYYIEVSNVNKNLVPDNYIRKQTLVNAERFITPELKEMEAKVLGAEEKLSNLEYEVFISLRKKIALHCERIQKASNSIAVLDVFISLAAVAAERNYNKPILNESRNFNIQDGRHPVVEQMNPNDQFVPNDAILESDYSQILLITGPNMAGKSTYLRQNALISLMAQIGSFVPACHAEIGIVDKYFTRVGASDRLAKGQSTFLVEMIEVANILNNATEKSLVLLDEVGRGTSTFDGISIAWAVAEYLHETKHCSARTFFATHYHELTELSLLFPRIKNVHIKVKEWNDQIIFLRKIDKGSCDHSYGIQVARLAGVPKSVIARAKEILINLESMELTPEHKPILARHHIRESKERKDEKTDNLSEGIQMNLLDSAQIELVQQLQNMDINSLTPLDALNILAELKSKASLI